MVILQKLQTRNLIITAKRKPELNYLNILQKQTKIILNTKGFSKKPGKNRSFENMGAGRIGLQLCTIYRHAK